MTYIPCPGGLSTTWKTKAAALKWLEKVNEWPCSPVSKCTGEEGCARGGFFGKVHLTKGGTAWGAQVFCYCPPPLVEEGALVEWTPVPSKGNPSPKAGGAKQTRK
ncbi:MAG TPA: hypothetical protein VE779_05705 [Candidatus Angelobacter sp.]|nr:hypothetical protein [Candidatus Angelobacter sp.]